MTRLLCVGLQVKCKVGDTVTKGQVVVVLEAMKMEYPITAPAAGQVSTLRALGCCCIQQESGQSRKLRLEEKSLALLLLAGKALHDSLHKSTFREVSCSISGRTSLHTHKQMRLSESRGSARNMADP